MNDITKILIEHSSGPTQDHSWLAVIHSPTFNNMRRFRTLPDALVWTIKEVAKE